MLWVRLPPGPLQNRHAFVEQPGVLACLSLRRTLSLNTCQYTVYVSAKCTDFSSLASNAATFQVTSCADEYPTCEEM